MGRVTEKPLVINGEIKIRKVMNVVYTLDHRIGDAALTLKPFNDIHDYIEHPEKMDKLD